MRCPCNYIALDIDGTAHQQPFPVSERNSAAIAEATRVARSGSVTGRRYDSRHALDKSRSIPR